MTGQSPTIIRRKQKICRKCHPMKWFRDTYIYCPYCASRLFTPSKTKKTTKSKSWMKEKEGFRDTRRFENKTPDTDRLI